MLKGKKIMTIKLYSEEHSVRAVAKMTETSPSSVQKYKKSNITSIDNPKISRRSQFDETLFYIYEVLDKKPKINNEVLLSSVYKEFPHITSKYRAFCDFMTPIKKEMKSLKGKRVFEPISTDIKSGEVQVDVGEFSVTYEDKTSEKVYFAVFILCYSRKMFISFQNRQFNTDDYIRAHLESFQYFGFKGLKYIYDQAKIVCINELYMECKLNSKFEQFAKQHNFQIKICEGNDPQSKGKVERMMRYIKGSFLYPNNFLHLHDLQKQGIEWLNSKANTRHHKTTGISPDVLFETEKEHLQSYISQNMAKVSRPVDKMGLINYKSYQYSVPYIYQNKRVQVNDKDGVLYVYDIENDNVIAEHNLASGSYKIIKNSKHYPDKAKILEDKIEKTKQELIGVNNIEKLLDRIVKDNPIIAKKQLEGLRHLSNKYPVEIWNDSILLLLDLPEVKISLISLILEACKNKKLSASHPAAEQTSFCPAGQNDVCSSTLDRAKNYYNKVVKNA